MKKIEGKSAKKNFSAFDIAKFFIWKSNKEKKPITNKKLQKLLYYSQAWSMALKDKPLFNEKIEAWVHGPAIRDVYVAYKNFGFEPIIESVSEDDLIEIKNGTKKLLDEVWRVYGKYDGQYLEFLTHNEKPWQEARVGIEDLASSSNEITLDSMKIYYSNLIKK